MLVNVRNSSGRENITQVLPRGLAIQEDNNLAY